MDAEDTKKPPLRRFFYMAERTSARYALFIGPTGHHYPLTHHLPTPAEFDVYVATARRWLHGLAVPEPRKLLLARQQVAHMNAQRAGVRKNQRSRHRETATGYAVFSGRNATGPMRK